MPATEQSGAPSSLTSCSWSFASSATRAARSPPRPSSATSAPRSPPGELDHQVGRRPAARRRGVDPGLYFQDAEGRPQLVSAEALAGVFDAAGSSVRLVILNACYSNSQAEALVAHVECVVGMRGSINDAAAQNFAIGFYGVALARASRSLLRTDKGALQSDWRGCPTVTSHSSGSTTTLTRSGSHWLRQKGAARHAVGNGCLQRSGEPIAGAQGRIADAGRFQCGSPGDGRAARTRKEA